MAEQDLSMRKKPRVRSQLMEKDRRQLQTPALLMLLTVA